jgi:hypothetical protein
MAKNKVCLVDVEPEVSSWVIWACESMESGGWGWGTHSVEHEVGLRMF